MNSDFEIMELEANDMRDIATAYEVTSDEQYSAVGEFVMGCKQLVAKIKHEFSEPKRKADEAHKAITAMEKRALEPVLQAIDIASGTALAYKREQDRLAKEEKERFDRIEREKREKERQAEAERLLEQGKKEEAEQVKNTPIPEARPTKFVTPMPKVQGLSTRMTWKAEVLFPEQVKPRYCKPDMPFIQLMVKNLMAMYANPTPEQIAEAEAKIGGIRIYQEETFAGRTR